MSGEYKSYTQDRSQSDLYSSLEPTDVKNTSNESDNASNNKSGPSAIFVQYEDCSTYYVIYGIVTLIVLLLLLYYFSRGITLMEGLVSPIMPKLYRSGDPTSYEQGLYLDIPENTLNPHTSQSLSSTLEIEGLNGEQMMSELNKQLLVEGLIGQPIECCGGEPIPPPQWSDKDYSLQKGIYVDTPVYLYSSLDNPFKKLWYTPYGGNYLPNSKLYWRDTSTPQDLDISRRIKLSHR